ncbi:DUF1801 domain-containing protein [Cryomorpha ignava]|uniref:DUF1801 domain-containing protein n=1 Tax=Cryomorpha ignava TaxID=101383 RepID=A0A7K3WRU1_9FLAO|nr:DUF1801 domain-containing protein [Cryomorpha ignava]NEN24387.1 DUF1801 domain-containing protein [Cryomorpha ignava]
MAKNKTSETAASVEEFINALADTEQKREDSFALLKIMQEHTGYKPKMWGPSIIGYGSYHYKYDSGHEGEGPLVGFSPRKKEFSLYVFTGMAEHEHLVQNLGKFRKGKACIYIKKVEDIDLNVLKEVMSETISYLKLKYPETLKPN